MAAEFNIPSLKDALKDFEKLHELTDKAAKSMLTVAVNGEKVAKSLGGDTLKKNVELQKASAKETDKLEEAQKKLIKAQSDESKELARINVLIQQQNQINKASAQTHDLTTAAINKEATSIAGARAQMALLTQARNNVNITTDEGKAKLVLLNDALDKNNAFIKANADAALKQKMAIGDYATGMSEAIERTGMFGGKLGQVTQNAIGFVQQGAQAAQKIKDINDAVVSGASKLGNYVTAKLGFTQAEKASTAAIELETIATGENAVVSSEAAVSKIGFTQAEKAAKTATVATTVATEASTVAAGGMIVAQEGVAASSQVMAVAETEAAVATGLLDVALGILLAPVTLIIAAVALLFFIFKDFAPIINPIKDAFAALSAVFSFLKQTIFDLITGARSLGDIFSSFGSDAAKAAESAMDLAQATRDLNKAMDINDVAMAQAQTRIQGLILQSKNRTTSEKERIKLIQEAQDIEEAAFNKTNALNNEGIRIAREKLFEGKNLSAEDKKRIEENDFAYIRSLKIKKNLDEEELKSYKDLLLKKEELAKSDQQIQEKAQNRKDQLEDKAKDKADKAAEKAKKDAEDAEKRQEEAVKKEIERRKLASEIAISAMKITLDYQVSTYDQSQNIEEDNLAFVESISLIKIKIAQAEMQKNLIGVAKGSDEEKKIRQDASQEFVKIEIEKNKAIRQIAIEGIKAEIELYELKNKTLIQDGKTLTDLLIDQEKKRIEAEFKINKEGLEKIFDVEDEKVKNKIKANQKLTKAEQDYFKTITDLESKKNAETKKADKLLLDSKLKTIETEEKTENRKYKLLNKGSLANAKTELKNEAKALKDKLKLYENDAEKKADIELQIAENKKKQEDLVQSSKQKGLQDSLSMFIDFVGKESELGKIAAVAQTTINTFEGASRALKDYPAPYSYIVAGLTVANGLRTVAQIEGIGLFAEGTDDAPYTGKAIAHEEGAELQFDKNWNLKSLGSDKGAQVIDIVKGDKIIPADISAIIRQTMFKSYGMKDKQIANINYDEIGNQFGKHASKIVSAVKNNNAPVTNIIIQKDMRLRASFKGSKQ